MTDADTTLAERLRRKVEQKAGDDESNSETTATETEADHDGHDEEDEDEEEHMDHNKDYDDKSEDVNEAAQMVAEAADQDVSAEQVLELLGPLFGDEDTRDAPGEMAADADDAADVDAEAGGEAGGDGVTMDEVETLVEEKLDGVEDRIDEKLEDVVDELAAETRDVMQKADVARTPTPAANGSGTDVQVSDFYSDDYDGLGGDN